MKENYKNGDLAITSSASLSGGALLRQLDQAVSYYRQGAVKNIRFSPVYTSALQGCAGQAGEVVRRFLKGWVPAGRSECSYGPPCREMVGHLFDLRRHADGQEGTIGFCHAEAFDNMRDLVLNVLQATGMGKKLTLGSGDTLQDAVEELAVSVPYRHVEPLLTVTPARRPDHQPRRALLTLRRPALA